MTPMIVEHPLLQHKISILRNKQTGTKEFRDLVGEIATLLCYEATRDLPLEEVEIETPITMAKTKVLAGRKLALVPILRAGMGMLDGMLTLLPAAKVGFIGLYRDEETLQPVEYFCKLPKDIAERDVLVLAFKDRKDVIRLFISGDKKSRVNYIQKKHGISERKAENLVDETDERRSNYQSFYAGTIWGYSGNYDLCLDVTKLGVDGVVAMVELYAERMGYAGDK